MAKIDDYLDEAKAVLQLPTDYKLAQRLMIKTGRISEMRQGKTLPTYLAWLRLGIILNRDPFAMIAEVELERETDPAKREFWKDFLSGVARVLIIAVMALHSLGHSPDAFAGKNGGVNPVNSERYSTKNTTTYHHNGTLCEVAYFTIRCVVSWFRSLRIFARTLRVTVT